MALKPLLVKIGADTSGLERGLKRAGVGLAGLAKAAGASAALVGGALSAMAVQGLQLGNEIERLSRRANALPEDFQRMAAGALKFGIDSQGLSDILQDVNDKVGDFLTTGAGGMVDFFETVAPKVGVTADMFRKLSGPQALQLYVSSLEKANLSQQEMTFFMEAIASESTSLLPLLQNNGAAMRQFGDEAERAGLILSGDMLEQLREAERAMGQMGNVVRVLQQRLAVELAPSLQAAAERFNELAQSDEVQSAIERLAGAFGNLAEIILSEDFMQAAIDGLAGIANVAASTAEAMVAISQHAELVTIALGGIATAAVLMGGPLTVAAGAIALVLGGMAVWKRYSSEMAEGSDTAKEAQDALNAALGTFSDTAAPAAGKEAIAAAKANVIYAESALAAAEAELEKKRAIQGAGDALLSQNRLTAEGSGYGDAMAENTAKAAAEVEAQTARLEVAQTRLASVAARIMGADYSGGGGDIIDLEDIETPFVPGRVPSDKRPRSREDAAYDEFFGPLDIDTGGTAGLSTADQLREQLEARLEVLTNGLMTEREVVQEWYEEGQTVLEDALAKGLLTEEEYREQRERLEEEHQKRMNAIKQAGAAADLAAVAGAGAEILNAIGQNNKKALKLAKVFGAAQALISTYEGASKELAKGGIAGFAAAAAVIAKGIGFVNAIRSVGDNGSTGGGGSTGSASSAAAAPAVPTQTVSINLQGDTFSRGSVEGLLEQIQSQLDRGGRLVFS
jgi:hypothetical protein